MNFLEEQALPISFLENILTREQKETLYRNTISYRKRIDLSVVPVEIKEKIKIKELRENAFQHLSSVGVLEFLNITSSSADNDELLMIGLALTLESDKRKQKGIRSIDQTRLKSYTEKMKTLRVMSKERQSNQRSIEDIIVLSFHELMKNGLDFRTTKSTKAKNLSSSNSNMSMHIIEILDYLIKETGLTGAEIINGFLESKC